MQTAKFRGEMPHEGLLCIWKLHQKTNCNQQNGLLKDYFTSFLTLTWTKTTGRSIIQLLEIFFFFYGICSVRSVHSAWKVWSVQDIQFHQVIGDLFMFHRRIQREPLHQAFISLLHHFHSFWSKHLLCPKISIPCEANLQPLQLNLMW